MSDKNKIVVVQKPSSIKKQQDDANKQLVELEAKRIKLKEELAKRQKEQKKLDLFQYAIIVGLIAIIAILLLQPKQQPDRIQTTVKPMKTIELPIATKTALPTTTPTMAVVPMPPPIIIQTVAITESSTGTDEVIIITQPLTGGLLIPLDQIPTDQVQK